VASADARSIGVVEFALAVVAGPLVTLAALFGIPMDDPYADFYARNASFFVLPVLVGYFAWRRRRDGRIVRWTAVAFAAALVVNSYPFARNGNTRK
jgi:hypothetical protein